jgi:hypothetical protein
LDLSFWPSWFWNRLGCKNNIKQKPPILPYWDSIPEIDWLLVPALKVLSPKLALSDFMYHYHWGVINIQPVSRMAVFLHVIKTYTSSS